MTSNKNQQPKEITMIDLEKILNHLDKQIEEYKDALHWAESEHHINFVTEKLNFLQILRETLTVE
jgi:hypothetical protein